MQTIALSDQLVEQAKNATGLRSARAAVVRLIEERAQNPQALPVSRLPKAVQQSERELRKGRGKVFTNAADAMKWLES